MPRRHHTQADFNQVEWEKIKKVQGDKTDYRFFRECVMEYVEARRDKSEVGSKIPGNDEAPGRIDRLDKEKGRETESELLVEPFP
jgi:hypothetical protein